MKNSTRLPHSSSSNSGFTLIELSIVLVIIGLIVGGVLVGRDLIEAANIRKLISDADQVKTAVNAFRLKYNSLPGDLPYPERYMDASGWDNCYLGANDCGGNGRVAGDGSINESVESVLASIELSNLGYLKGALTFPAASYPNGSIATCGVNMLRGALGTGCYQLITGFGTGASGIMAGTYDYNWIVYGNNSGGYRLTTRTVTPQQAFRIDAKIDDGKATSGRTIGKHDSDGSHISNIQSEYGIDSWDSICFTANHAAQYGGNGADYRLAVSEPACLMAFRMD